MLISQGVPSHTKPWSRGWFNWDLTISIVIFHVLRLVFIVLVIYRGYSTGIEVGDLPILIGFSRNIYSKQNQTVSINDEWVHWYPCFFGVWIFIYWMIYQWIVLPVNCSAFLGMFPSSSSGIVPWFNLCQGIRENLAVLKNHSQTCICCFGSTLVPPQNFINMSCSQFLIFWPYKIL